MRTKRTGLICLFIGAINFCLPSAEGQEIKSAVQGVAMEGRMESSPATAGVQLRLDVYDTEAAWNNTADSSVSADEAPVPKQGVELREYLDCMDGDSAIKYTAAGIPVEKKVFRDYGSDEHKFRIYARYIWENNTWVSTNDTTVWMGMPYPFHIGDASISWAMLGSRYRYSDFAEYEIKPEFRPVYDNDKLVSVTVGDYYSEDYEIQGYQEAYYLTYNENNDILHIEMYNYDRRKQIRYRYDANGNATLYEETLYDTDNLLLKMTCEYDADSRPLILSYYIWNETLQQTALDWYEIYYYSEGTDANEAVDASPSSAWSYSGLIHIRSERPQQVAIYSLSGAKLYESSVPAGTVAIDAARFLKGVHVVAFGNGTRQKIAVY
jgi:hypothetical protein